MTVLEDLESAPVVGVSFRGCVPHIDGAPLTREREIRLYEFLSGEQFWNRRREADLRPEREGLQREAAREERRVRDTVSGFLAAVTYMIGSGTLTFKTPDGRDVDVERIDWMNLGIAIRGPHNPNGWDGPVPRLIEKEG